MLLTKNSSSYKKELQMKAINILPILVSFLFLSCNFFPGKMKIGNSGNHKKIVFDGGTVKVYGREVSNFYVTIYQKFTLSSPITIDPNDFKAKHNNQDLASHDVYVNGYLIDKKTEVTGKSMVMMPLTLVQPAEAGDTIKINFNRFIKRNGQPSQINDEDFIYVGK